jgi:competence protein ComEC
MQNKGIFYALSGLIGALAAFHSFILFFVILCLYLIFLMKRKKFDKRHMVIILLLFLVFFSRAEIEVAHNRSSLSGQEQTFYLFFNEIAKIDGDQLTIKAMDQKSSESLLIKYRIKSEGEKQYLQQYLSPELFCKVNGELDEPSISSNENAFDYKTYLQQNHIYWILKPNQLNLQSCQKDTNFFTYFKKVRADGIRYLQVHFPSETVPLAAALLFGTSDLISSETMDDYQELGIVHLLAISGLHIAIIVAIVYYLFLRIGLTKETSIVLLLICLPIYCILTGASPSVNRSVLMTMLLLIGRRWGNHNHFNALDVISLTFLLYVFIVPYAVFNVGFQLSFIVTFTLLVSSSYMLERYENPVSLLMSTSFLSMLTSAPLLLYFFFEFSVITLFVNLLYIPIFNFVLLPYLLFVYILHLLFGNFMDPFLYPINKIIIFMNTLTEKIASLPWNTVVLGRPNELILLFYGWGLLLFLIIWERGLKGIGKKFLLFLFPCLLFTGQFVWMNFSLEGEITFLDVGQGDCIYIRLPFGQGHYLIDTGGNMGFEKASWQARDRSYEVGRDTVVPFLKSKGVTTIDKLIVTHGDMDHAGGAAAVLQELKVRELVLPDRKDKNELEKRLVQTAVKKKVVVQFVHAGDSWQVGENHFYVVSPEENSQRESNDGSIVLYTKLGGLRWLFTGDLEEAGEANLLKQHPTLLIDVLKVGHHGSKTSTTELFLDQLSPKIAVISVGENNSYRHPNQEVMERLAKRKIKVMRTDLSGAITYTFKKESGTFSAHKP